MEIMRKIRLSQVAILFAVVVLISSYFIFARPTKLSTYMEKKIDIGRVSSIRVREIIDAYVDNEFDITDLDTISAIMDYLGNITTQRQLFPPDVFPIVPYETYLLFIEDEDRKNVSLSVDADYVTIDGGDTLSVTAPDNFRGLHDLITADGTQ